MEFMDILRKAMEKNSGKKVVVADARPDLVEKARQNNERVRKIYEKYERMVEEIQEKAQAELDAEKEYHEALWEEIYRVHNLSPSDQLTVNIPTGKIFKVVMPDDPEYNLVSDESHKLDE